ncbi:MAG: SWIM zinc finger domain-containing protein, partial [Pirellulaceae bacterium]
MNSDGIQATVRGDSRDYAVEIRFDAASQGVLTVECDCPYHQDVGLCKHIWAVLVGADRQLRVRVPPGGRVMVCPLWEWDDLGPDAVLDMLPDAKPFEVTVGNEGAGSANASQANWSRMFREIQQRVATSSEKSSSVHVSSPAAQPVAHEICYVINVSASYKRGQLAIDLFRRNIQSNGTRTLGKRITLASDEVSALPNEEDRHLVSLLMGNDVLDSRFESIRYLPRRTFDRCRIVPALYDIVLPRLAATGRFAWQQDDTLTLDAEHLVAWDGGGVWTPRLRMITDSQEAHWRLEGVLERDGESRPASEAVL